MPHTNSPPVSGLRADHPCRQKRGREPGESSARPRAGRLSRPAGDQGAAGSAPPGMARHTPVGRSPTARLVVASTGVGERVKCLMIFRSTICLVGPAGSPRVIPKQDTGSHSDGAYSSQHHQKLRRLSPIARAAHGIRLREPPRFAVGLWRRARNPRRGGSWRSGGGSRYCRGWHSGRHAQAAPDGCPPPQCGRDRGR